MFQVDYYYTFKGYQFYWFHAPHPQQYCENLIQFMIYLHPVAVFLSQQVTMNDNSMPYYLTMSADVISHLIEALGTPSLMSIANPMPSGDFDIQFNKKSLQLQISLSTAYLQQQTTHYWVPSKREDWRCTKQHLQ